MVGSATASCGSRGVVGAKLRWRWARPRSRASGESARKLLSRRVNRGCVGGARRPPFFLLVLAHLLAGWAVVHERVRSAGGRHAARDPDCKTLATNHAQHWLCSSPSDDAARTTLETEPNAQRGAGSVWSFIPFPPCYTECGRRLVHASRAGEGHTISRAGVATRALGAVAGRSVSRAVMRWRRQHRSRVGRTRAVAGSRREHGYHHIRS